MTALRSVVNLYSSGTGGHHKVEHALYDGPRSFVNFSSSGSVSDHKGGVAHVDFFQRRFENNVSKRRLLFTCVAVAR